MSKKPTNTKTSAVKPTTPKNSMEAVNKVKPTVLPDKPLPAGVPSPKDFDWKILNRKGWWDGETPGVYACPDPYIRYGKQYPPDYITDPVTKVVVMKRVTSYEIWTLEGERMMKADRSEHLKSHPELVKAGVLPVEYFGCFTDMDNFLIATSFGPNGEIPVDIDPNTKIKLESKRGTRVQEYRLCDECCVSEKVLWRYSKSNRGVVYLCSRCKDKVLDRSFGKIDAIWRALRSHFEGNPRRH